MNQIQKQKQIEAQEKDEDGAVLEIEDEARVINVDFETNINVENTIIVNNNPDNSS